MDAGGVCQDRDGTWGRRRREGGREGGAGEREIFVLLYILDQLLGFLILLSLLPLSSNSNLPPSLPPSLPSSLPLPQVRSKTSTIDKHALPAWEAVLQVLAHQCERLQLPLSLPPALHPEVTPFLLLFRRRLQDAPATRAEALTTARGIAIFARLLVLAPVAEEGGREGGKEGGGVGGLLAELATLSDRALSQLGHDDREGGREGGSPQYSLHLQSFSVRWRSALLEAAARVLLALPTTTSSKEEGGREGGINLLAAQHRSSFDWLVSMAREVLESYWSFVRERPRARLALLAALQALAHLQAQRKEDEEGGKGGREGGVLGLFLSALLPAGMLRVVAREDVLNEAVGKEQAEVYAALWREIILACDGREGGREGGRAWVRWCCGGCWRRGWWGWWDAWICGIDLCRPRH